MVQVFSQVFLFQHIFHYVPPPGSLMTFDSRWGSLDWLFAFKTTSSLQLFYSTTVKMRYTGSTAKPVLPKKTKPSSDLYSHLFDSELRNHYGKMSLKTAFEDCFMLLWATFMGSLRVFAKALVRWQLTLNSLLSAGFLRSGRRTLLWIPSSCKMRLGEVF